MSGNLFGDLELGKSFGISQNIKLKFSKTRTLIYASGNCLNAIDLGNTKEFKSEGAEEKRETDISILAICNSDAHSKILIAESPITAFAVIGKDNIIAYAERYSNVIKIVRWSQNSGVVTQLGKLQGKEILSQGSSDINIVSLSFSPDMLYLATLGELPDHQITVWDWKAQKQISSISNGFPADEISFNPLDSKMICVSSKSGRVKFWKIKIGFKKYTMVGIDGGVKRDSLETDRKRDSAIVNPWEEGEDLFEEDDDNRPKPINHVWIVDRKILTIDQSKGMIFEFRADTGTFELIIKNSDFKLNSVVQNTKNTIVGCQNGIIRVYNLLGDFIRHFKIQSASDIVWMEQTPDYQRILVEDSNGMLYLCDLKKQQCILIKMENLMGLVDSSFIPTEKTMVTLSTLGKLSFWNPEKNLELYHEDLNFIPKVCQASPNTPILSVGSSSGVVRIYSVREITYNAPKLLFRRRIHSSSVNSIKIDQNGIYMVSAGDDNRVFVYNLDKLEVIGYIQLQFKILNIQFEYCDDPAKAGTRIYVLQDENGTGLVSVFDIPNFENISLNEANKYLIDLRSFYQLGFEIPVLDFFVVPKSSMSSKSIIYVLTPDSSIKIFATPSSITSERVNLLSSLNEFKDHLNSTVKFMCNYSGDWILTLGQDGLITLRSVIEPEKSIKLAAHDSSQAGAFNSFFTPDYKYLITLGRDGLLRRWDWKYSVSGRRAASEFSEAYEKQNQEQQEEQLALANKLEGLSMVTNTPDSSEELPLVTGTVENIGGQQQTQLSNEKEIFENHIKAKVNEISQKIQDLMKTNDLAPDLEKIDRSEFIIDLSEKQRLLEETENSIKTIKQEYERKNIEKRVIKNRIKNECWDSCEVHGQGLKSFKPNLMLQTQLVVQNYPIRKRSKEETLMLAKIKRLRKIQLSVSQTLNKNSEAQAESLVDEFGKADEEKKFVFEDGAGLKLLYNPFDLNTKERRRVQTYLLSDYIQNIKSNFNLAFKDMVNAKQEEISRIEEKNERIASILSQLQLNDKIYRPELDDDEIPESVIIVKDSEVKAEKFLSAEELAKLEAKRLQAEERMRAQGEDNWRERALYDMMWGKLEDRKAQEDKEEFVKPEWMSKPKEDMTDEEKKLLKEYEKKMAIFKEEQDKHRKALETELRKLQMSIGDIQDAFDNRLREFSDLKLKTDSFIYEKELSMIKQNQYAITSYFNDSIEMQLVNKIEKLKLEKIECTNEIPEIKKELERTREDYESALRRDKELDKQFKKEFHGNDYFFEILNKLYKKRTMTASVEKDPNEEDLNPFSLNEKDILPESFPSVLNQATDMPDGLNIETWNKLVEIREKKIQAENDISTYGRNFKEMQALVQNVLEESDYIKSEMENTMVDLNNFLDFKFRNSFNIEVLYGLKQGQVEVPQAPIVTDYTDALLLHRTVVENLNEQVRHLGQQKVEALTEMKDYRKGIHALEWENKMQDFQADDLIIRSRDIQLLRVTKEMQEYLRSGDAHKQATEVLNLEKVSEHSQRSHLNLVEEKHKAIQKMKSKIKHKKIENSDLEKQIKDLMDSVDERKKVKEGKSSRKPTKSLRDTHRELFTRRRLVDLAKSQAQDIAILREELERLRLRTYPAFRG